jgi:hypothetical protein
MGRRLHLEPDRDGQPWITTTVEGEGCDLFWPCIDHPQGKPQLIDLHISVPAPLVVAGNGVATGMDERTAGAPTTGAPEPQHLRRRAQYRPYECCPPITPASTATPSRCACGT